MDLSKEVEEHIRSHLQYPATKTALVEQCNKMADVPEDEKAWLERLPERRYSNADDVISELTATIKA